MLQSLEIESRSSKRTANQEACKKNVIKSVKIPRKKSIQNDIRINNLLGDYKSGKISLEICLNQLSRVACITL